MRPYLIAEIGINHNGSLDIAKKLIDASVDCNLMLSNFKREIDIVYSKEILDHIEIVHKKNQKRAKKWS